MIPDLLAQAPPPGPDPQPYLGYILSGLAVAVFYTATRVDTGSAGPYRRLVTRALLVLAAILLLVGLAAGVDRGP